LTAPAIIAGALFFSMIYRYLAVFISRESGWLILTKGVKIAKNGWIRDMLLVLS